jgi:hypothetical protein
MNDAKGLHSITNPSSTEVAVSLHIYSPPFRECKIFQPLSGESKTVSMVSSGTPKFQDQGSGCGGSDTDDDHSPLFYPLALHEENLGHEANKLSEAKVKFSDLTIQDFVNALQEVGVKS